MMPTGVELAALEFREAWRWNTGPRARLRTVTLRWFRVGYVWGSIASIAYRTAKGSDGDSVYEHAFEGELPWLVGEGDFSLERTAAQLEVSRPVGPLVDLGALVDLQIVGEGDRTWVVELPQHKGIRLGVDSRGELVIRGVALAIVRGRSRYRVAEVGLVG